MRPIEGFPGYWIDRLGNVYSGLEQRSPGGHANGFRTIIHDKPIKKLTPTETHGYLIVGLSLNKRMYIRRVHHLVLRAFVGPKPYEGAITRHLNGNKKDNRAINLAWGTPAENTADNIKNGVMPMGEKSGMAKTTAEIVRAIRKHKYYRGLIHDLSQKYNLSVSQVRRIWKHESWTHL